MTTHEPTSASLTRGQLPTNWTTRRVAVRDAADDDTPALTAIFNACTYAQPWDPTFHPVDWQR